MTPQRLRLAAFVLLALTAGGLFLAWSQPWFAFSLETGSLTVRGDVAAGALPPLALVSLAMILALALAGTVFRIVFGVLEVLVGVGAIAASAFALGSPIAASAPAIAKAIGLTGQGSASAVAATHATAWPVVAIVTGRVFDGAANPSNLQDWQWLLDQTFEASTQLSALDQAVSTARKELGYVPNARVMIAIPFPSTLQDNFGDVTGSGAAMSFNHLRIGSQQALQNRTAAVNWYIDQVLGRWRAASFQNLDFVGFYWYMESVMNDVSPNEEQLVSRTAAYIHGKGYQFSWIPGNVCPGFRNVSALGFDVANMQPSYMFQDAKADRLHLTAALSREHGLGIEMEVDDMILQTDATGVTSRAKFLAYLDYGVTEQYMNSYVAWYQQVKTLLSAARSTNPSIRGMYDRVYQFIKGQYRHSGTVIYP